MLNPFIDLISAVIDLYFWVLVIWMVLSWLIAFNVVNRHQPFVYRANYALSRLTEPLLAPIRRLLPDLGGIDFSPIVLILLLQFLQNALYHYLYRL